MGRIIGFAGRKESGKNVLCDICVENGFKLLYFALPLKQLTADLIGVRLEDIEGLKPVESSYKFNDNDARFIECETGIPFEHIKQVMCMKEFKTVREILQVLGTDCIRKYDNDWHVRKIMNMVEELGDCDVCISDIRYPNEANMVRNFNGDVWFISRPYHLDNISNHASETSFGWVDADAVIINNGTLDEFILKWRTFLGNYERNMELRESILVEWEKGCVDEETADKLYINKAEFSYRYVGKPSFKVKGVKVSDCSTKYLQLTMEDGSITEITNPLEIEDFKRYIS